MSDPKISGTGVSKSLNGAHSSGKTEQHSSHHIGWVSDTHHGIRVPVTEIHQSDSPDGTPNEPLQVYRTMGPSSVPEVGLEPWRAKWIAARGDTETYQSRGVRLEDDGPSAVRRGASSQQWRGRTPVPIRARAGRTVTQMHYARQGIITPEMRYVALRELRRRDGATRGRARNRHHSREYQ